MLSKAEVCGLALPENWQQRFAQDALAPSVGVWRGFGKYLITRRARKVGLHPTERYHASVAERYSNGRAAGDVRLADALKQAAGTMLPRGRQIHDDARG